MTTSGLFNPRAIEGDPDNDGYVLRTVGGVPMWLPSGVPTGGTTGQVLTKQSGTDFDADWDTFSGLTDPTTTKGDLIVNDGSGIDRLGVGATGEVLVADPTAPLGVDWAPAAGGILSGFALDPTSLHATYGDHFTSSSLAAKWNRVGYVSGDEQHQMGGGTWMQIDTPRAAGNYWYQTCPAGDFTVTAKMLAASTGNVMVGPLIVDNTGKGVASFVYASSEGYYVGVLAGAVYNSTSFQIVATRMYIVAVSMLPVWLKLEKSGTAYRATASVNGQLWRKWTATVSPASFTPTRMGFGAVFGTPDAMAIDWFNVQ